MVIYNVTVKIDKGVEQDWVKWMKEVHIPEVMATGYFLEYRMSRIIMEDPEGTNYSIQYIAKSEDDVFNYQEQHAAALQADHTERYKDKFVAFRTLMEIVDHNSQL